VGCEEKLRVATIIPAIGEAAIFILFVDASVSNPFTWKVSRLFYEVPPTYLCDRVKLQKRGSWAYLHQEQRLLVRI
jgi:hypothetical protein